MVHLRKRICESTHSLDIAHSSFIHLLFQRKVFKITKLLAILGEGDLPRLTMRPFLAPFPRAGHVPLLLQALQRIPCRISWKPILRSIRWTHPLDYFVFILTNDTLFEFSNQVLKNGLLSPFQVGQVGQVGQFCKRDSPESSVIILANLRR